VVNFWAFERGDETLGHRRPRYVVPLDWDDHNAVIGLADGGLLQGLSGVVEEIPNAFRNAGDRGHRRINRAFSETGALGAHLQAGATAVGGQE
jgi:hypothetical protein